MVSAIYSDPMHGYTVEITHSEDIKTRYSNLDKESVKDISVGDSVEKGSVIGTVGDTSFAELAEEPHLHFEMKIKGASVNPLDYIDDASKKSSLGIVAE
jgi:murein DD-endopeptidase MepM/ murein hydrolase activator NlpD